MQEGTASYPFCTAPLGLAKGLIRGLLLRVVEQDVEASTGVGGEGLGVGGQVGVGGGGDRPERVGGGDGGQVDVGDAGLDLGVHGVDELVGDYGVAGVG